MNAELRPDERALRTELSSVRYTREVGCRWGIACMDGTKLTLPVFAKQIEGSPDRYVLRIDCENYPAKAPTATFWDVTTDAQLSNALRPWGSGKVALVFRTDWPDGAHGSAFYHPCDRKALDTHADWPNTCPKSCWSPDKGLTHYLNEIYALLHSEIYTGVRGTAA